VPTLQVRGDLTVARGVIVVPYNKQIGLNSQSMYLQLMFLPTLEMYNLI
jgi:hypothetical protein